MNGIVRDRYADWKNRFDLSPNVLLEKGIAVEDFVHGLDIVIHTCREAWLAGIMVGFNGNMSMRLGEDLLLVTGTTVPKGHLTDNDVALICVDGTRIAGPAISSETAMHTDVYKAVPDARFILHTHPTHLLSVRKKCFPCRFSSRACGRRRSLLQTPARRGAGSSREVWERLP